jgi:hypothetical protein
LGVTVHTQATSASLKADVSLSNREGVVAEASGAANTEITLPIPRPELWTPESPVLYDVGVTLTQDGARVDSVGSYVGLRQVEVVTGEDGTNHVSLNGERVFLLCALDQGYWPDGIYTAPTDEALAYDLEQHKRLGFNTVRKHVKVEPDRWYYHADRLGLMVWQDMPSMRMPGRPSVRARRQFEKELHEIVDQGKSWTCIIGWVVFNEGWGEWSLEETARIAASLQTQDPTRLVNAHSGANLAWTNGDSGAGDVLAWHEYVGPAIPPPDQTRVSIDGEHGGFGLVIAGHVWPGQTFAYEMAETRDELTAFYVENQRRVLEAARGGRIAGAVYTQITDVEGEVNGFLTYDRVVEKMDFDLVRKINDEILRSTYRSSPQP